MATGDAQVGDLAAGRAIELKETAPGKTFFAQWPAYGRFTADNGRFSPIVAPRAGGRLDAPRATWWRCGNSLIAPQRHDRRVPWRTPIGRGRRRLAAAEAVGASGLDALVQRPACAASWNARRSPRSARTALGKTYASVILTAAEAGDACDKVCSGFYCAVGPAVLRRRLRYSLADGEADRAQPSAHVARTGAGSGT